MIFKAMHPELWEVSAAPPYTDLGVIVTKIAKPQKAWRYSGEWSQNACDGIPAEIREKADEMFRGLA